MNTIALKLDGTLHNGQDDSDVLRITMDTHSTLDNGIVAQVAFFQTQAGTFTAENTDIRIALVDSKIDEKLLEVRGNLVDNDDDYRTVVSNAYGHEDIKSFDVQILSESGLHSALTACEAMNTLTSLNRAKVALNWNVQAPQDNIDDLFDIVTNSDVSFSAIYMMFNDNVRMFTQALRIAQKLNIALTVEIDPRLPIERAIEIAELLNAQDHRVRIVYNTVHSRPNYATSLRGKVKPRLMMGTQIGRIMLRNANINSNGIPPLHILCAGYDYPFNWGNMQGTVKMTDQLRNRCAEARINVVYQERFKDGIRTILGDCLTQYDLKRQSPLEHENGSDISLFIEREVIHMVREDLLKPHTMAIDSMTRKVSKFLESCSDRNNPLLTYSDELGGYYHLSITKHPARPNDGVLVKLGCKPETATRAVYLETAVYGS